MGGLGEQYLFHAANLAKVFHVPIGMRECGDLACKFKTGPCRRDG